MSETTHDEWLDEVVLVLLSSAKRGTRVRGHRRPSVVAGSRALQLLHRLELALDELAEVDSDGADLAVTLAVARDRLERHYLEPHRGLLDSRGLAA